VLICDIAALGEFVPVAFENIAWRTYIIFGVFNVAMFIHVFFAFPETAGRPLEEVNELFDRHIPAWKTGNTWSKIVRAEKGDVEAIRHGSLSTNGASGFHGKDAKLAEKSRGSHDLTNQESATEKSEA
jgi:Sugar (and other) transporter